MKVSLVVLCLIALCGSAQAGEPNPSADDHSALTLMGQLEMDFRRVPRIVKMQFSTTFSKRKRYAPVERTLWAICNGDTSVTQLLNVIVAPSRMQGTTLLFADHLDPDQPDSTWLYLVAFKRISHVTGKTQRALVPGTALSYEDSRGFIPVEKYDFQFFGRAPDANSPRVTITATPKTEQLREDLGVSSLTLQIDTRKRLITRVDYVHSGGKIFKTYRTLQSVELSGIWLPQQVKVDHIVNGIHTTADYQYWPLTTVPESELFRTDGNEHNFFENLKEILEREGLDSLLTTGSDDSTAE